MKRLALSLMGITLSIGLFSQISQSKFNSDYHSAIKLYHMAKSIDLKENQMRGGQAIHLDSIISPMSDDDYIIARYIYDGNTYNRVTFSNYSLDELLASRGQIYVYDTRLKTIQYFNTDINTGIETINSRDDIEYDDEGRVASITHFANFGNGLFPDYKIEFDHFRDIIFRIRWFEADPTTGDFVPDRRYIYDRLPDGEYRGIQIDSFDIATSQYGRIGYAEYIREDNRIVEELYAYDRMEKEFRFVSSFDYSLDPFSGLLNSRTFKLASNNAYSWTTEFQYDLADQVFTKLEKSEYGPSQKDSYSRFDYAYDYGVKKSDLHLPPEMPFDGFLGLGFSLDPDIYHHKLDFIRTRNFDEDYIVESDVITDYFWSDDALTSTSVIEKEEIRAFPNPVTETLNIVLSSSEVYDAVIYDALGGIVDQVQLNGESKIVVSDWPTGVYVLRAVKSSGEILQTTIMKH